MQHHVVTANDAQGLAFVQGQAYRVNAEVITQPYPQWDFSQLVFVETTGNPWAPGVLTYTSDFSGRAQFVSGYAKDMPFADVSQDVTLKSFHLAGIGYQYNLEEVNTALNIVGGTLSNRRAQAARRTYMKFMWDLTVSGNSEKGMTGLINQSGVTPVAAANDGTGTGVAQRYWANKTPGQIVRDINQALAGPYNTTFGQMVADTILLPDEALQYIAGTPFSNTTMETVLSFVQRVNIYTMQTGRPLKIRGLRELAGAATASGTGVSGTGRMVAYLDDPSIVKLHLPMPHQFLPVYQDGWANFVIPGIFRTGGLEVMMPGTMYYLDGITAAPAP